MNIRKMTFEDRFARKYFCNSYRFVHYMKRRNRKLFRQRIKKETKEELMETISASDGTGIRA